MESLKETAAKNSIWEFIAKIIEKIGGLVFTIILARLLLPEGFGAYSLTMSVALIFIGFINYSINAALIRYVSDAIGKKNKKLASAYFKYLLKKKIIFTLVSSVILIILAYPLAFFVFKKPFLFIPFFVAGFYVFVLGIEGSYEALFYVFKQIKRRTIKELFKQVLRVLVIILIFLFVAKSYYVVGTILGLILTSLIIVGFMIWYVKKFAVVIFNGKAVFDKKKINTFVWNLIAISVIGVVFSYIDVLIMGALLAEVKYVGLYSAVVALIWGILGMLNFTSVFLPIFTQFKKERLNGAFNELLKYSFIMTVPAAFGLAVLAKYIIFLVYGIEYLEAWIFLFFMAFVVIEGVGGTFIKMILLAREKIKPVTKISVYALVLSIALNLILIYSLLNISQFYATLGAVIATLISRYYLFFSLVKILNEEIKIKLDYINFVKPIIASLAMFLILFFLIRLVKDMNIVIGISLIVLGILVYGAILFLIGGISKEDKIFYKELFNKTFIRKT